MKRDFCLMLIAGTFSFLSKFVVRKSKTDKYVSPAARNALIVHTL